MIVNSLNLLFRVMNIIQRINKYLLDNSSTCGNSLSYQEFERDDDREIFPVNEDPEKDFINNLIKNGFEYNNDKDWYERSWTTNNGKERIVQTYKKKWVETLMSDGEVFYEA